MSDSTKRHWSNMNEKGGLISLKLMLLCYRVLGKKLTYLVMYPVMVYYYMTSRIARQASKQYLTYLRQRTQTKQPHSFRHFMSFGQAIIDKLAVWSNKIPLDKIDFPNKAFFDETVQQGRGGVIFTAHMGNLDIARSLSRLVPEFKINLLVFSQHSKKFHAMMERINPEFKMNTIEVKNTSVDLAIQLREKIEQGEFVVIGADRTSVSQPERNIPVRFLNHQAYLPQGAFILAGLLKCPAYFMSCSKQAGGRFTIGFQAYLNSMDVSKSKRTENLSRYAQMYANYLENFCVQYPLQWFNFFDFWAQITLNGSKNE